MMGAVNHGTVFISCCLLACWGRSNWACRLGWVELFSKIAGSEGDFCDCSVKGIAEDPNLRFPMESAMWCASSSIPNISYFVVE